MQDWLFLIVNLRRMATGKEFQRMSERRKRRFRIWPRFLLRRAGWEKGVERAVPWEDLPVGMFPAAREIIREFHGVSVGNAGKGRVIGRAKLRFDPSSVDAELVERVSSAVKQRVYPLGDVDDHHAYFFVTENGEIYLWYDDPPVLVANSIDDAIERMLLGYRYGNP